MHGLVVCRGVLVNVPGRAIIMLRVCKIILGVVVLGLILAALWEAKLSGQTQKPPLVLPEASEYRATGMIKSARSFTQVVPSSGESGADGQVVSFKNLGDRVAKGQEVIECEYLKGKQMELAAGLQKAKLQKEVACQLFQKCKEDKERYQVLWKTGAISQATWNTAVFSFLKAELDFKAADQDVIIADQRSSPYNFAAQFDSEVISVSDQLQKGFIIAKYAKPIELMRLANLDQLEVTVEFPYLLQHRIGGFSVVCHRDKAKTRLPGWQTSLQESNGTLYLTICFDNSRRTWKPFEAAEVLVSLKKDK